MRLFVAINFNEETRARLLALRDNLRARAASGRFSPPENLHLTLVFLGECDARQTAAALAIVKQTAFAPFPVKIERIGRFRRDGGDLWWAGAAECPPLMGLQRDLAGKLAAAGFVLDQHKYTPHITLARETVTDALPWPIEPFGETAREIALMKSERVGGGMVYTPIL